MERQIGGTGDLNTEKLVAIGWAGDFHHHHGPRYTFLLNFFSAKVTSPLNFKSVNY